MDFLDMLSLDDLDGDQLQIAELIGMESYKDLVRTFGGNDIRILQADTLCKAIRDDAIRREYNGRNMRHICRKYNLCDKSVRTIIGSKQRIPGQLSLIE